MPAPYQSRRWVFTEQGDGGGIKAALEDDELVEYAIAGDEVAPTTGQAHVQGYVFAKKKYTLAGMKKTFSPTAHWEVAQGSHEQNKAYCSKDKHFREYGTFPLEPAEAGRQSERKRWERTWELACEGKIDEVDADIRVRYYHTLCKIRAAKNKGATDLPHGTLTGTWIYGESGTGKSSYARCMPEGAPYYLKQCNVWWDGYQGEDWVIIDDIGPTEGQNLTRYLKLWADRTAFPAQFKGGSHPPIRPRHVIVTSQYRIEDIWPDKESQDALNRRFTKLHKLHWKNLQPKEKTNADADNQTCR